jgi:hypothetical protein
MQTVTTVGLDIAKSVFQVHCVDAAGQVVVRGQLKSSRKLATGIVHSAASRDSSPYALLFGFELIFNLPQD